MFATEDESVDESCSVTRSLMALLPLHTALGAKRRRFSFLMTLFWEVNKFCRHD